MDVLQLSHFESYLKPRPKTFHKGDAGHVLVVGGYVGMSGAIRLAAEAALRVGAGLVSVATRPEHAAILNCTRPEIMCHPILKENELQLLLQKVSVIVLGPGLGQIDWSRELFHAVLQQDKPMVIDADALNLLAQQCVIKKNNWILTPHPGEAGRLLKKSVTNIQADRMLAVKQLQDIFGGVCVLKGAGTLIAEKNNSLAICHAGNPGMATAGMGDVLSGVIGGLLAQHIPLEISAKLGVLLHALAGDLAAQDGERGMIASDLMPYFKKLVNRS